MITLLGSLIGFGASLIPSIIKILMDQNHKKHELIMMEKKIQLTDKERYKDIEGGLHTNHSDKSIVQYGNNKDKLQSSVRPIVTYGFFLFFILIKISLVLYLYINNCPINKIVSHVWDQETQVLFTTIISFWFGQRSLMKVM